MAEQKRSLQSTARAAPDKASGLAEANEAAPGKRKRALPVKKAGLRKRRVDGIATDQQHRERGHPKR